jgi:Arc/MetJ-type ribon-helix-helix transcriptional regulator
MSIRLKEEQERRLRTYVDEGRFPTIDDAAQCLLDKVLDDDDAAEHADDDWMKPYIDEAEEDVRQGRVSPAYEHLERVRAMLAKLNTE